MWFFKIAMILATTKLVVGSSPTKVRPVVVPMRDGEDTCPSTEVLHAARQNLSYALQQELQELLLQQQCGPEFWRKVVSLDMNDNSHQCPSGWTEYSSPTRSCGRPSSGAGCNQTSFSVDRQYSKVCGRARGRNVGTSDAFVRRSSSDGNYVDGLSVTHSIPREHIWTFAADQINHFRCPCNGFSPSASIAEFVGENYFCGASGNSELWDGEGCVVGLECCNFNSPPWFSVQLPAATTDNIDVRLCADEDTANENIYIDILELFVKV